MLTIIYDEVAVRLNGSRLVLAYGQSWTPCRIFINLADYNYNNYYIFPRCGENQPKKSITY